MYRTEVCKIIQACSNFRGTVAANWLLSATACQSAIFGKIGKKTINLAGIILHLSVQIFLDETMKSPTTLGMKLSANLGLKDWVSLLVNRTYVSIDVQFFR